MSRPIMLDSFCGAGGAAAGYHRAGFDIVGTDIAPQPNYPYTFIQTDSLEYLAEHGHEYDAHHASPPCQAYSTTASLHTAHYPKLIGIVRIMFRHFGRPYVIENVEGARRELINPIRLCGSYFDLGVRRHRLFEVSPQIGALSPPCAHYNQPEPIDVTGTGGPAKKARAAGGGIHRKPRNLDHAREVMGIDWMTRKELAESVPPLYTRFIGDLIMEEIRCGKAAA